MDGKETFVPIRKVCELIGVLPKTVRGWNKTNSIKTIKTPTGQTLYSTTDVRKITCSTEVDDKKEGIVYARVSSKKQSDDLERQVALLRSKYPDYRLVTDIGSGINFKKKGLKTILEQSIKRNIKEIVVAHKDRLARIVLEQIIELNGGRIVVLDDCSNEKTTEQELAEDLLSIIHIYSCRQMGKRRYTKEKKIKEQTENEYNCFESPIIPNERTEEETK